MLSAVLVQLDQVGTSLIRLVVDHAGVDMTKLALTMPDHAGVLLSISSLLSLSAEEGIEGEEKDEAYYDSDAFDEHIADYIAVDVLIVCKCGSVRRCGSARRRGSGRYEDAKIQKCRRAMLSLVLVQLTMMVLDHADA